MQCFAMLCSDTSEHLKLNTKLDSCVKEISGGKNKKELPSTSIFHSTSGHGHSEYTDNTAMIKHLYLG